MTLYVHTVEAIRERLPVEAVLSDAGHRPGPEGRYLCPFHDDRNTPNLVPLPPRDGDPAYRYFCNACGAKGDVLDLIQALHGGTFAQAQNTAARILDDLPPQPTPKPRKAREKPNKLWELRIEELRERALDRPDLLAYAANFPNDDTLEAVGRYAIGWGWGMTEAADVVMPHRGPDGELTGVRVRDRSGTKRSHGTFPYLYGTWRVTHLEGPYGILVCEGESDAIHAGFTCPGLHVLALPSASAWNPSWLPFIQGFNPSAIYTGFDNDTAGRNATNRWQEELATIRSLGQLPPKTDLRTCGVPVRTLIESAANAP